MGATNVKAVYVLWGHLPDRPFRLLAYMAVVALDEPTDHTPARTYWQGRDSLAVGLGRKVPSEPRDGDESPAAEEVRRDREAIFRAVGRALTELRQANAITTVRRSAPNHQAARYELQLTPAAFTGHSPSGEHRTVSGSNAGRSLAERRTLTGGTPDAERPLEEPEEPGGLREEQVGGAAAQGSARARDRCWACDHELTVDGDCVACPATRVAAGVPRQHHHTEEESA